MKIRYAINARIPIQRAHGLQVMKTCEALARAGADQGSVPGRFDLSSLSADELALIGEVLGEGVGEGCSPGAKQPHRDGPIRVLRSRADIHDYLSPDV